MKKYYSNELGNKADKIKKKLTDATDSTNQSLSPSLLRESSTITSTSKKEVELDQELYIIP